MAMARHLQCQKFLPEGEEELLPEREVLRPASCREPKAPRIPAEEMSQAQNHAAVLSETLRRAGLQVISFCKCESFDAAQALPLCR